MKVETMSAVRSRQVERKEELGISQENDQPFRRRKFERHRFARKIRQELRALCVKNNYNGIFAVLQDIAIIGLAIFLCMQAWNYNVILGAFAYPFSVIVLGSRMRALATLLHEASHEILAKNRHLNYFLGTYCSGYLVFQTYHRYRQSHCKEHHKHLGDIEKDPDLKYYASQGLLEISDTKKFWNEYLRPNLLLQKLPENIWYLLKNRLLMPDFKNQKSEFKREYYFFIIYWVVIIAGLTYFGLLGYFFLFWIFPYVTTFQIFNCTIEVCEHYPIIVHSTKDIYMTRNRNGSAFELFLFGAHAENFHLIHHLFAGIPFWNLHKAHQILLQDAEYRFLDERSGGIITPSKVGGKTIIQSMFQPLNKI